MEYTHKVEVIAEHFKISTLVDLLKSLESKKVRVSSPSCLVVFQLSNRKEFFFFGTFLHVPLAANTKTISSLKCVYTGLYYLRAFVCIGCSYCVRAPRFTRAHKHHINSQVTASPSAALLLYLLIRQ